MTRLLQRLRGLIGTALTWAAAWVPVYLALGAVGGALAGVPAKLVLGYVLFAAVQGGISGLVFGAVTMVAERGHTVDRIRPWRAAMWGIIGATAAPVLLTVLAVISGRVPLLPAALGGALVPIGIGAALGAGSATGTLALARRPQRPGLDDGDTPELPASASRVQPNVRLQRPGA